MLTLICLIHAIIVFKNGNTRVNRIQIYKTEEVNENVNLTITLPTHSDKSQSLKKSTSKIYE